MYYNYKNFHSTVLMAICDAQYKFTYVDIGHYGKDNDASIFSQSDLYDMLQNNRLPLPEMAPVGGVDTPYYILGDEIFALKTWLMKPYSRRGLTTEQQVFNYRLSRSRRTIENAFGILSARWRIFHRPIKADLTLVELIIKATTCLHNYLLSTENTKYVPSGFVDSFNNDGMRPGDWRSLVQDDAQPALHAPPRIATRNYSYDAKEQRDHLCRYINSTEGSVGWQATHVASCGQVDANLE